MARKVSNEDEFKFFGGEKGLEVVVKATTELIEDSSKWKKFKMGPIPTATEIDKDDIMGMTNNCQQGLSNLYKAILVTNPVTKKEQDQLTLPKGELDEKIAAKYNHRIIPEVMVIGKQSNPVAKKLMFLNLDYESLTIVVNERQFLVFVFHIFSFILFRWRFQDCTK